MSIIFHFLMCKFLKSINFARCITEIYSLNKTILDFFLKKTGWGTSLVIQWLRLYLPMQVTQVRSLVGELRSHTLQGNSARAPQLLSMRASTREKPTCWNEVCAPQPRPRAAKNKQIFFKRRVQNGVQIYTTIYVIF